MAGSKESVESSKLEISTPRSPPFDKKSQLVNDMDGLSSDSTEQAPTHLAGYPLLALNNMSGLRRFLMKEFVDDDLDAMAPKLWWMTMQSYANVTPLHRQRVKGREIVVAEQGKLHLLWIYDRIFIKPLPPYLLSHAFWEEYFLGSHPKLGPDAERIRRAALGYIRTYSLLIRYRSDFIIAKDPRLALIPENITWEQFNSFISRFSEISDDDVCERWTYGEIRITRLNFYCKFILRKMHFHKIHGQYGTYFGVFIGPILFLFGILSVILSAMQVEMNVEALVGDGHQWIEFWNASRYFSIVTLFFICILIMGLAGLWTYMVVKEWDFALRERHRRKQPKKDKVERHPTA